MICQSNDICHNRIINIFLVQISVNLFSTKYFMFAKFAIIPKRALQNVVIRNINAVIFKAFNHMSYIFAC